jgi:hypothetical protein
MDGSVDPLSSMRNGGATSVALTLAPGGSALLVLDPNAPPQARGMAQPAGRLAIPADGWSLKVEGHVMRKAYAHDFGQVALEDWREVPELAGFAGNATYRRTINVDAGWLGSGMKVTLDLGEVHDMATVTVNGRTLPPAISAPYRVDLTGALKSGQNDLAITIANVPQNAMIDPKDPTYRKLKPVPAGWTGPVMLEAAQ